MAPTDILSLPLETTQEIGNLLPRDLKMLRLVCSQFNLAFEREVLATLVISITKKTLKSSKIQLEMLASKKTRAAQLARTLKINDLGPFIDSDVDPLEPEPPMKGQSESEILSLKESRDQADQISFSTAVDIINHHLRPAISSLTNLKCVVWKLYVSNDPSGIESQAVIRVMDALTSLSHIQELQLTVHGGPIPPLQLGRLSGLKKISIDGTGCSDIISGLAQAIAKSLELVHLEVYTDTYGSENTALHELLSKIPQGSLLRLTHLVLGGQFVLINSHTLSQLRSLVHIDLYRLYEPWYQSTDVDPPSFISDICAKLNREEIHLKHVVVNNVDDVVLDYLQSYSGLETLQVSSTGSSTAAQSDSLAYRFYHSVLPKHVNSIQVLELHPSYEGGWCYNLDDVFVVLAQCNKLRSLSIALTSGAVEVAEELDPDTGSRLAFRSYRYRDNFVDMISSLINLSLSLDHLTEISISSAGREGNRGARCGNPGMQHSRYAAGIIARSVANFNLGDRKSSKVLPDILVNQYERFKYQALGNGQGWGYKSVPNAIWSEEREYY